MDIRRKAQLKNGDDVYGNETRVKVVKNKVSPPFKTAEFEIIFGEGISTESEIINLGTDLNILQKSGSWYSYDGTKIGQGRDAVRKVLQDNPELSEELRERIVEALREQKDK